MTKLAIIKKHKAEYTAVEANIATMQNALEKAVAQHIILAWIKGSNWMGGLSDSMADKAYSKVVSMGYTWEQVDAEFSRQASKFE